MADKSLSTYAHNVKIISQNGTVTLKGPVKSDDEKTAVIAKAVAVAGSTDDPYLKSFGEGVVQLADRALEVSQGVA